MKKSKIKQRLKKITKKQQLNHKVKNYYRNSNKMNCFVAKQFFSLRTTFNKNLVTRKQYSKNRQIKSIKHRI